MLIEVPRFLCLAFSTLGHCPKALLWLRYNLFIILYPGGFLCKPSLLPKAVLALIPVLSGAGDLVDSKRARIEGTGMSMNPPLCGRMCKTVGFQWFNIRLPNKMNFSFDFYWFLHFYMLVAPAGEICVWLTESCLLSPISLPPLLSTAFLMLYNYMLARRRKKMREICGKPKAD
jgi:hypothetical protein